MNLTPVGLLDPAREGIRFGRWGPVGGGSGSGATEPIDPPAAGGRAGEQHQAIRNLP